jgi:glutamine amidotransferase
VGGELASLLNFAVTDGRVVVASRFSTKLDREPASLYFASGSRFKRYQEGDYRMVQADRRTHCHLVASEPLTNDRCGRDWIPVPRNHLIVITPSSNLLQYPIHADVSGC